VTYHTAQIAQLVGVHPNTVRVYEAMGLLPPVPRAPNGYRLFDDTHLAQLRLLRAAFRAEIVSNRLRQEAVEVVRTAAAGDLAGARGRAQCYLERLREERAQAEEAIGVAADLSERGPAPDGDAVCRGRSEAAAALGVTSDVLRDWERNGLIQVPRPSGGRKCYSAQAMVRLKMIRTLRNAHYSMMSILRMLNRLDAGETDLRRVIDTPGADEDIVSAADRYITALGEAEVHALEVLDLLNALSVRPG